MMLLLLRHLQLMLRFGANGDTPYAFVTYGILLCGRMGDIKEGHRFGKLALQLLEQCNDHESRVVLLAHSVIVDWQSPIQESIDPILRSHKVGMARGDVVNVFLCSVAYCYFFYHWTPIEAT
jgi:predicted ATPase